jgi:capsid protein
MSETYFVSAGIDASVPMLNGRRAGSASNRMRTVAQPSSNDFAAIKSGLDDYRSQFYGTSGRMPNTKADATRRQRSLSGGSGARHLTQLDLWTEREISRHLRDHSSMYSGMIETWAAEVIQCGFKLKPATGNADLNILLKELLFGWDGDGGWMAECDARGLMHFWDIMTLSEETEVQDGDHALYLDPDGNNGRGSIAIIEADRVLTPYGVKIAEGYTISNGIVWNAAGYPVSVFIADTAPLHAFCSVENGRFHNLFKPWAPELGGVVLSIELKRPTSSRRQPWLSTAVRTHDEVDDVFVAVRIALRNAACRSTFTEIADWDAYREWLQLVDPSMLAASPVEGLTHSPNPGDHTLVNPGEKMGALETDAPGANFDPFMHLQLTTMGLPLGMCIEEAFRIFQKSFSASRMAVDSTRRRYERRQKKVKRRKVTPCLLFAIACHQKLKLLPKDPRCNQILCGYPGWPYMEPLKDAQAGEILIRGKQVSRHTLNAEIGYDFEAEVPLIQAEDKLFPTAPGPSQNTFIDAGGNP